MSLSLCAAVMMAWMIGTVIRLPLPFGSRISTVPASSAVVNCPASARPPIRLADATGVAPVALPTPMQSPSLPTFVR